MKIFKLLLILFFTSCEVEESTRTYSAVGTYELVKASQRTLGESGKNDLTTCNAGSKITIGANGNFQIDMFNNQLENCVMGKASGKWEVKELDLRYNTRNLGDFILDDGDQILEVSGTQFDNITYNITQLEIFYTRIEDGKQTNYNRTYFRSDNSG
jgi:hypothetical protein